MADVSSVMTSNPASCSADTSLRQVAQLMIDNDCGLIPVVDGDKRPVGTVTDRDIATRVVATGGDVTKATAADAMTTPITTVDSRTGLQDAVRVMEEQKIRRLVVVDGDGRLAGVAALADLARAGKEEATAQVVREVSEPGKR